MTEAGGFPWQDLSPAGFASVVDSTARINLWEGAVRSSKTICSIVRWLEFVATAPPGDFMFIGKTERTVRRNILNVIEDIAGKKYFKYNKVDGEGLLFGRRFYVVGANDEKSETRIRGITLIGAYGDEVTTWPENFFRQLMLRLSLPGAAFFGTTNPDNPKHWLKTGYIDRAAELDCRVFHFELTDNPSLTPEYIANLAREYVGLWHRRFVKGEWVAAEGAVYDMFDETIHVIDEVPAGVSTWFIGIDYGTANPTAALLVGEYDDAYWVAAEYYYDGRESGRWKTDEEYALDIIAFAGEHPITVIYRDPSAISLAAALLKHGIQTAPADNSVVDGIRTVSTLLAQKRLFVCRSCTNLVREFGSYSWDPKAQALGEDRPLKKDDHCLVAGTMVETATGPRPIESIAVGDLVLTRAGYHPVIWAGMTNPAADVMTITLDDGRTLTGTGNHPVWVDGKSFVPLDTIRYGDHLRTLTPSSSTASHSAGTPTRRTGRTGTTTARTRPTSGVGSSTSTSRSGRPPTARSPRATTSTTKTGTRRTTRSTTSNASRPPSTSPSTPTGTQTIPPSSNVGANTWLRSDRSLSRGTSHPRVGSGTASMVKRPPRNEYQSRKTAPIVASRSIRGPAARMIGSARTPARPGPASSRALMMSPGFVLGVVRSSPSTNMSAQPVALGSVGIRSVGRDAKVRPVYNLTVDGQPEFFANGILVHNCLDALRYLCHSRESAPKPYLVTVARRAR